MTNTRPAPQPPSKAVLAVLLSLWLVLTLNLCVSVALYQINVLTWDQWDFYNPLFNGRDGWTLFSWQHGPHRQGLGFILTSWLMDITHWDTRWDSLWIAGLVSLSGLLAIRLKWKLTGTLSLWDAWLPILSLSLTQYETILITPNASHSAFPLALLLLSANVWLEPKPALRYFFCGAAAVCLAFTGFGLFGGAMLTVLLGSAAIRNAISRRWREAALASTGLAIALAGWFTFAHGYRFDPAVAGFRFPWTPLTDYARFIAIMLLEPAAVTGPGPIPYFFGGVLSILILSVALFTTWKWLRGASSERETNDVLLLLLGAGVLFVCNTAVGRVCLGINAGMVSRYVSLMLPLWIGLYVTGALSGRRVYFVLAAIAVWTLALWPYRDLTSRRIHRWPGTLGASAGHLQHIEDCTTTKAAWVDAYLKTGSWQKAQADDRTVIYPDPAATKMDQKLHFLKDHQLSFFSAASPGDAYLPWLLQDRVVWNNEFPTRNTHHSFGVQGKLMFLSKHSGFLEVLVARNEPGGRSVEFRIDHDNTSKTLTLTGDSLTVAVPVTAGVTHLLFTRASDSTTEDLTIGPARLKDVVSTGSIVIE